jgi:phosphoribosylformylglycinamidine cyclo-ligase
MTEKDRSAYADSGVNIDNAEAAVGAMKDVIKATYGPNVLSQVGNFGGLLDIGNFYALVASTDGVGTKLQVAIKAHRHGTVGADLVNHCLNDLTVQGPVHPLFFLDYLGFGRLDPIIAAEIVAGLCGALREYGCALLGGETAEMPGTYVRGQYDLVGTIVGMVAKDQIINGSTVVPGDTVLGISSGGLGTNGYSLARKTIFQTMGLRINDVLYTTDDGTKVTVADELLRVHPCYHGAVHPLMERGLVKTAAHITGGGIPGNLVRVLPHGVGAYLDRTSWSESVPPVFDIIRRKSEQEWDDYFRTFNDGIGMILVVSPSDTAEAISVVRQHGHRARKIGRIKNCAGSDPSVWIKHPGSCGTYWCHAQ